MALETTKTKTIPGVGRAILKQRLTESLFCDSKLFQAGLGSACTISGELLWRLGKRGRAFSLFSKVHRAAWSEWGSRRAESAVREAVDAKANGRPHPMLDLYRSYVATIGPTPATAKFFEHPESLLNGCSLVLKSPGESERGVLILYYSYIYPLFHKYFDLPAISKRYALVLEPSWSGFCDLNVLSYQLLDEPVVVGALEPRDADFLKATRSNLVPVSFSSNSWVDDRVFRPDPSTPKDIDILIVSGWGWYKRHWAFFSALKEVVRRGRRPRVALIGYPLGLTANDILEQAQYYGVRDLVEIHEWLKPHEVAALLNRAKVLVLWSRKEGVNRSIIESMFTDTPVIVREGFNYGYHYPYINEDTGRFASEKTFPNVLLEVLDNPTAFAPRKWAMEHLTLQALSRPAQRRSERDR